MAVDMSFLIADPDYYRPWYTADPGARYQTGPLPAGWVRRADWPWTHCSPPDADLPDQGWKVHVSSSLANAQAVLAVVALACAEGGIPFKHLTGRRSFVQMHDKHAARVQAGKFCTLYSAGEHRTRQLMQRLATELAGISGPFVLTDRRFGDSECVSYRYGAFRSRTRLNADGVRIEVLLGPDGEQVDDQRVPEFRPPPGLTDPFREAPPASEPSTGLHGYRFDKVIQHSNAGGAYLFHDAAGEPVFIKEARSHNGYTADGADAKTRLYGEYLTLRAIHGHEPGLGPRPIELFHQWEHSFLVTERVSGTSLYRWMVVNHPVLRTAADQASYAEYYQRCLAILDRLAGQLRRLHELGYVFVDLSPTNVLVDDADQVRLIDFEAVQPMTEVRRIMGTPGYQHPDALAIGSQDAEELDRYGIAALALMVLFPLHESVERHPPVLHHLQADLTELAPVPSRLWRWATSYHQAEQHTVLPTPQAIRDDTPSALRWLADRTADTLEAMARPDRPDQVYPTIPLGYQTNTRALAAGTAGVLHALHRAGRPCDPAIVRRLRDGALAAAETDPPGLLFGSAGIAGVLVELGEGEAAEQLLLEAARHPLNQSVATLASGSAGTAYGLIAHYRRTGEQRWLELAQRLVDSLDSDDELAARLSQTNRSGLVGGRTGLALTLHSMYELTGDDRLFRRGMQLLQQELAYSAAMPVDGLGFKTALADRRVYPYLFAGSAGYIAVLSRYLADRPDADFDGAAEYRAADALDRCLRVCQARFAAFPGLFSGLAGLAGTLAEVGHRLDRPDLVDAGFTSARGLFRYAVPREDGVGWLGEPGQRFSADLWSGSAGILLALQQLLERAPVPLNALAAPRVNAVSTP